MLPRSASLASLSAISGDARSLLDGWWSLSQWGCWSMPWGWCGTQRPLFRLVSGMEKALASSDFRWHLLVLRICRKLPFMFFAISLLNNAALAAFWVCFSSWKVAMSAEKVIFLNTLKLISLALSGSLALMFPIILFPTLLEWFWSGKPTTCLGRYSIPIPGGLLLEGQLRVFGYSLWYLGWLGW